MGLFACDNTLVIMEDYEFTLRGMIKHQLIHLWNLKSLDRIYDLDFLDVVDLDAVLNEDITNIHVCQLIIADNKLAVNLYFDMNGDRIFQTHFWKLDTLHPSADNIHHWTKIDYNPGDRIYGELHMNSNFFCGKVEEDEREIKIRVFNFEDISKESVRNIEHGLQRYVTSYLDWKLEQGMSNRFAMFNKVSEILQVFDFSVEHTSCIFQVDFSHLDNLEYLTIASFYLGKMILVKRFWDEDYNDYVFSFVIVNEQGDVVEGNKQMYKGYLDVEASYHVDINGVLAFTNEDGEEHDNANGAEDDEKLQRVHFYH